MENVTFNINVIGNASVVIQSLVAEVEKLQETASKPMAFFERVGDFSLKMNAITDAVKNTANAISLLTGKGVDFDYSMRELSAITGATGEKLEQIGEYAREAAMKFGGNAADAVEGYKLLLSQLSPELADKPEALKAMGESVSILSKALKGDAAAAAETLTTAMNQYGVSLTDPMKASEEMANMMNVMSAAANIGSAELPQIKAALEQAGMSAKTAGISFEETNAAIQVLDKAGKKGSEGGVALRNVMNILSRGRFLPPNVQEELTAAGVNIHALGDKTKPLSERLGLLKGVYQDSALFSKLFGDENAEAAMALVDGAGKIDEYTEAVTGTTDAYDYATTVMDSYKERQSRIQAMFDDMKISIFNVTGDLGIWMQTLGESLIPLAQIMPLITGVGHGLKWLSGLQSVAAIKTGILTGVTWLLNTAFWSNPVTWIVAGIAALIAVVAVCWNKFAGFRAVILTVWDTIKNFGNIIKTFVIDRIRGLLEGIGAVGQAISKLFKGDFEGAWNSAKEAGIKISGADAFAKAFDESKKAVSGIGDNFSQRYEQEQQKDVSSKKEKTLDELDADFAAGRGASSTSGSLKPFIPDSWLDNNNNSGGIGDSLSGVGGKAASGSEGKIRNINITIDKVIDKFTVQTTNLKESGGRIKDMVAQAVIDGVNDVNLAF